MKLLRLIKRKLDDWFGEGQPSVKEVIGSSIGAFIAVGIFAAALFFVQLVFGEDYPKPDPVMYVKERDNNMTLYVAIIATIVSPSILAFFNNRARRKEKQAEWEREDKVKKQEREERAAAASAIATAAELVKKTLAANELATKNTLAGIVDTGNKVHILTNNNMEISLTNTVESRRAGLVSLQRIAKLTKDPVDSELARLGDVALKDAEKKLEEHRKKQAKVDSMPHPPIVE
jgi:hypothetical protein